MAYRHNACSCDARNYPRIALRRLRKMAWFSWFSQEKKGFLIKKKSTLTLPSLLNSVSDNVYFYMNSLKKL